MKTRSYFLLTFTLFQLRTPADTLTFSNGRAISGTILQTNGDNLLLLADYAAFRFSRSNLKDIKLDHAPAPQRKAADRLPDYKSLLILLSKQAWARNLEQIPATVIDKGMLRNVPYMSFRCGDDYEINIYGDPDHPAGIEAGVYRKLLTDKAAQANCLRFIADQLSSAGDKDLIQVLNREKDMVVNNGLTFEITPPTDPDAYNGWWVSVYDEASLNKARASDDELPKSRPHERRNQNSPPRTMHPQPGPLANWHSPAPPHPTPSPSPIPAEPFTGTSRSSA